MALPPQAVRIKYRNYRGVVEWRRVVPTGIEFGATAYHDTPQWLLQAWCAEREAPRTFAVADILEWIATP